MKWHRQLCATLLSSLLVCAPLNAWAQDTDSFSLSAQEKTELAQLENRRGESLRDRQRDPAKAFFLSALYPGLGHLYIGNDNERSLWIMGGGTAILVGSIAGFALLADRPPEASSLGNTLITLVALGYWAWNIRDAQMQADTYNKYLARENLNAWIQHLQVGYRNDTLTVGVQLPL